MARSYRKQEAVDYENSRTVAAVKHSKQRALFKRIAEPRAGNVLRALTLLSECSDKSRYDFDEHDIRKMEIAFNNKIAEVIQQFRHGSPRPVIEFD